MAEYKLVQFKQRNLEPDQLDSNKSLKRECGLNRVNTCDYSYSEYLMIRYAPHVSCYTTRINTATTLVRVCVRMQVLPLLQQCKYCSEECCSVAP